MKTFFTADLHFGSKNTFKYGRRPFETLNEMNNVLLENFNKTVTNDDIIYILGDFAEDKDIYLNYLNKINGKKIYILLGNYEKDIFIKSWCDELPDNVELIDKRHFLIEEFGVEIVHEPTNKPENCFYLFAHTHQLNMIKRNGLCVSTDCHNFKPIDWDEVLFFRRAIENTYDQNVFMK